MAYSSHLEISIGTTAAERDLARFQNRLELTDRAGDGAASSVNNVGLEVDRMRNTVMRASGVLAASAGAIGLMARQSSDAAREIKNLSRLAGADVVTFQKMTMASRAFGIEQEQLAQIMLDTQDRIGDFLQTGQGEFADFFEQIAGKSDLTAQALARMAGPEALQAIYNALEDANLSASETVFYMESLASDATRLIPLLKDNGAGFKEVADEAERLGVALSEIEIDQLTALRGEFADLEQIMSSSTSQIIAQYSGEITSTVNALGEGVRLLADNFDTLQDAATLAAGVMTARFVSAMAAGTASIAQKTAASIADARADAASAAATVRRTAAEKQTALALLSTARLEAQATKGTAAHTFALQQLSVARTRAATAAGAHTAAMNVATAATARASVAARGLSTALSLVGGPLGLLVGAAGLLYVFRDELNLTGQRAGLTEDQIRDLRDEMKDMSQDDLSQSLSSLNAALDAATIKAATAREELAQLRSENRGSGALGFGGGELGAEISGMQAVAEAQERIAELNDRINVARGETASRIEQNANAFVVYADRIDEANKETRRAEEFNKTLSSSLEDAAEKTYTLADAYESLLDRITPNRREARQYAQDLGVLNLALASGRMNTTQYMQAMGMLQESFQAAQRDTTDLTDKVDTESDRMAKLWERRLERMDDAGVDMWRSFLDGSEDAFGSFKSLALDTLAEVIHAYTTQKITASLGLNAAGIGSGSSSGGFGGIGSLISGGKSLLGLGSTAATGTALNGGFMSAAATQSAGSLYGMAATGGVAQAGLASSIAAGISTAMPWIAGGLAIDSLLGGGITKAISGLFGSKSRGPSFDLMTTNQDPRTIFEDVQHGVTATGAFGNVGFHGGNTNRLEETFGSFDNATQFLETIAATDDLIAALAPGDVEAMTYAIQQMRLKSSDAAGIADQLGDRTKAAFGAMSGDFGAFARTLTGSTEEIIAQAQTTQQAHALLTSASERLGLQFNIAGGYAYEAAQDIAQLAGGVENLSALQQSYYQNFFTEAERAAHLTADLTSALGSMGLQLPETREGFRQLVEAQDLSTESGRQAYAQLLQLSASFSELTPEIQAATDAVSEAQRTYQQLKTQELRLLGDTEALRQRELDTLREIPGAEEEGVIALQERIWALEDEQEAQRKAEKAQADRIRKIEQEANAWQRAQQQLASFGVSIDNWIDNLRGTDAGLGTPGDQLAAASQAFDEQYAKALSGDQAALGSITQYADRFIEAQKGWSASGEQTVSTIDRVTGMLEKLPDQLTPEQFLAEEFKGIIDGQTTALLSGWNGGFDSLLSSLSADFGALDTSLDGLLSFDELKAGLAGKATDSELRALIGAVDKNGDGLISRQELTNATISDLRLGITSTLSKSFADLDSNVDGLLTFGELKTGLGGIATDAQLKAMMQGMDLNNDSVVDKLESVVVSAMPTDGALTNVLRNQMQDLRTKTLTSSQVRAALRPIATDAEIENLIKRVDANGDGIISEQELANSRLDSLSQGIAGALEPMFSSIDLDASGLIDYNEFGKAFEGMATDEQLKNIFSELDRNGDGVISALEAVRRSSMDAEGSIKTIEDFFYRAGSPSWGLRVSMSHHQNVDAVKSFGYHTAKEMRREFSPSGTGIGVSLAAPQNGDGARSIATAFKQILGPNRVDGSHASGAWNIGFDGYLAELHKGEMVVPAGPAQALRELAAGDSSLSMASMPAPAVTMSAPPLPQFPLLDQTDVTQVMRDMQRTIEQKNEQIVELLKEVRGNTGQTRDAVMGVGKGAHQQREQQSRQLDRLNRNTKEKVRTP